MRINPEDLRTRDLYRLLTSLIVPRPIAWVGTRSPAGVDNLAPFSYFMGVSSQPPAVAISVARRDRAGTLKDTAQNILDTRQFTVSLVGARLGQAMADTAAPWPSDVSEFEAAGVALRRGERVEAPMPDLAVASMECQLIHSHDLGSTHLLVGQVMCFHLADHALRTGQDGGPVADLDALDAISRLGGSDYAHVGERFSLQPKAVKP